MIGGGVINLIDIPQPLKEKRIIDLRWTLYKIFLDSYGDNFSQVLVTDTRDIIFQDDLFKHYEQFKNYLGYSTEYLNLDEECNANWFKKFYGEEIHQRLIKNKIICCGTVFGTVNEVKMFAQKMSEQLERSNFWGAEQAAENYLVYEKLLPIQNIIESDVNDGAIFTNGITPNHLQIIRDNKILNLSGNIPAVVHQYDRHLNQVELVNQVYRLQPLQYSTLYDELRSNVYIMDLNFRRNDFLSALSWIIKFTKVLPDVNVCQFFLPKFFEWLQKIIQVPEQTLEVDFLRQAICKAMSLSIQTLNPNKN